MILLGIYFKIGIYSFNNWILSITKRLNLVSIYVISIVIKSIYVLIFIRYSVLLDYNWLLYWGYFMILNIGMISVWSLLRIDIKSILMISSIVLFSLFLLINKLLASYIYIIVYLMNNLVLISSLIDYSLVLFLIGMFNMISIRCSLGFFIKLSYFKTFLQYYNIGACISILLIYIVNVYLYVRLLYNILINKSWCVLTVRSSKLYFLFNLMIFLFLV